MRADRLVAVLLLLQARGRVTAVEVARELEVSERTARRDLEALGTAGIPVYSQRGRGGGWALVGGARTDLTGLTADEIRALFLVTGPSSADPALRTALRKLVRALPGPFRAGAEAAARAGVADPTDWSRTPVAAGERQHLDVLQRAVVDGVQVRLGYARPGEQLRERIVHPLGLVAKAGLWYLVAVSGEELRIFRLNRIGSVSPTEDPVVRPNGFDLPTAWRRLAGRMEDRLLAATVQARADRGAEPILERVFAGRLRVHRPAADGRVDVEIDGPSPEVVAAQLAGLGARVEVLAPAAARLRLAQLAGELAALYGQADGDREVSPGPDELVRIGDGVDPRDLGALGRDVEHEDGER